MGDDIKLFNLYAKGRCRDKFLAMKHVCGLSDLQYDILVEKWCSGRVGMTRTEIAEKHHVSERTLDREYADEKSIELYKYVDGRFREFEQALAQQAVYNATNTSTIACLQNQVAQLQALTKVVIPYTSICPEPMSRYNSWTAPTTPAATTAAAA